MKNLSVNFRTLSARFLGFLKRGWNNVFGMYGVLERLEELEVEREELAEQLDQLALENEEFKRQNVRLADDASEERRLREYVQAERVRLLAQNADLMEQLRDLTPAQTECFVRRIEAVKNHHVRLDTLAAMAMQNQHCEPGAQFN